MPEGSTLINFSLEVHVSPFADMLELLRVAKGPTINDLGVGGGKIENKIYF